MDRSPGRALTPPATAPEADRTAPAVTVSTALVADAHVHFHRCFDREVFFDAALSNFAKGAASLGLDAGTSGVLLLSEAAGDRFFATLCEAAARRSSGRWSFRTTAEADTSIWVLDRGRPRLLVVNGRQLVTRQQLEVLALACPTVLADGMPLDEALQAVREAGGLPVVPWGFGKWWFRRGRVLRDLLAARGAGPLFLGDSGDRPCAPAPRILRAAARAGVRVLPGSDPLPFSRHMRRAGSFGFALRHRLDTETPAAGLRAALADPRCAPIPYGDCRRPLPFLGDQLAMLAHKHLGRGPA